MPAPRPIPGTPAGLVLRFHRQRQGVRMRDLAARVSAGPGTLSHWERGLAPIPPATRAALAEALGLDPTSLAPLARPETASC